MRFWLMTFLFLCAVMVLAVGILELDAPVRVAYGGWQISPPLSVAVVALLIIGIGFLMALRAAFWLLFLPKHVGRWRRHHLARRGRKNLREAMRLMAHGESGKLLKVFGELQGEAPQSAWQCAQLAEQAGDMAGKKRWLQKAAECDDRVIATAAKAELCRMQDHLSEAERILRGANALAGPAVLTQTYYAVSKSLGNWSEALRAAEALRGKNIRGWDAAVGEAILSHLDALAGADELHEFWKNGVASGEKKTPKILARYIARLFAAGAERSAAAQLEAAHKQFPADLKILGLVATFGGAALKQSALAQNEKRASVNDTRRLQLLMQLAQDLDLPGKAAQYKQMASSLPPA